MQTHKIHIWCAVLLVATVVSQGYGVEYTRKAYDDALKNVTSRSQLVDLFKDYISNAGDVDVVRRVQDEWYALDSTAVVDYFRADWEKHPLSAKASYFYGRIAPSLAEKIELGRKTISLEPGWSYGYRLLLSVYPRDLFMREGSAEQQEELKRELQRDETLFERFAMLDTTAALPAEWAFQYYIYKGNAEAAQHWFDRAARDSLGWADEPHRARILAVQRRYEEVLNTLNAHADWRISQMDLTSEQKADAVAGEYLSTMRQVGAFAEGIRYLKTMPLTGDNAGLTHYNLAVMNTLAGNADEAFKELEPAVASGYAARGLLLADTDLEALHSDSRWITLQTKLAADNARTAMIRLSEVRKAKIDKPAPDWELKDANGNTVKLSDLKGQIVVLDFWATWCGPCRIAMPMLDKYMRTRMPEGVRVFSVNVWEEPGVKSEIFMESKKYAMTLLHGNKELANRYEFDGIPYLCAIDEHGHIRYEEHGIEYDFPDKLPLWIQDLQTD